MVKNSWLLLLCLSFVGTPCYSQVTATKFIPATDSFISYMGRIGMNDSCAEIYWTGSSVTVRVKAATTVKAMLDDENGNNYYYVIVDGNSDKAVKIKIDREKNYIHWHPG